MKTLLSVFSVFILVACSGTATDNGTVITSVPGGGTVVPVKKAPGSILTDFSNINIQIACSPENCTDLGDSLQALEDSLQSFKSLPKGTLTTISLADGATLIFDSIGQTLDFPSTIAASDVQGFFAELTAVSKVEGLIGNISLAFPSDAFTSTNLSKILQVLTTNRPVLIPYEKQISVIDFVPNTNSFSKGTWSVDRTQLQNNFQQTFNVIKPSL